MKSQSDTAHRFLENPENGMVHCYNLYGRKLLHYAIRNWNLNEDQAWELIYKTLYRIRDTIKDYQFESEQKFQSFLFKIFVNYLRNFYRNENRKTKGVTEESLMDYHEGIQIAENSGEESRKMLCLKEELNKLEDWKRILLLMRAQNYAYAEIAKIVDKPESQLKVYYGRLRNELQEKMNLKLNLIPGHEK